MNVYIWIILLCIFQIIDGATTYVMVGNGLANEMNPIVAYFMEQFGNGLGLIIPKFIVMLLGCFLIIKYWSRKSIRVVSKAITFIYFIVACLNLFYMITMGAI